MSDSRLILITGMSGSGKSTTAQQLAKQYQFNKVKHVWLHEEIADHPIREGEFEAGSLHTEEGMAKNIADMYDRWTRLADEIASSDSVYIMEGCLYQMIVRYFFACNYPEARIAEFYDRIMEIISGLDPTVVYLCRSDVRASFEQAFRVRGERWRGIILDPDDPYFATHPYQGEESTYALYEHQQRVAAAMFDRIHGRKIMIDTSDGRWDQHHRQLTEYLGLQYVPPEAPPELVSPERYCGRYVIDIDGRQNGVTIKFEDGVLYCQMSWWSNMKLIPKGDHEFEAESFPIGFRFNLDHPTRSVEVLGTYGWGISGKTLLSVDHA